MVKLFRTCILQLVNIKVLQVQTEANDNVVCIFVSHLNPRGGGIFAEVKELADMYNDKQVYIFQTDEGGISDEARSFKRSANCLSKRVRTNCLWAV